MLRAAASSLNQFEGDGSFLENFQGGRPGGDGSASDSDADRSSTDHTPDDTFCGHHHPEQCGIAATLLGFCMCFWAAGLCSAAISTALVPCITQSSLADCLPAFCRGASGDTGGQPSEPRLPAPGSAARQQPRDGRGDGEEAAPDAMRQQQPTGGAAAAREPAQQSTAAVASAAAAGGNLSVAAALRARLKVEG